MRKGHREGLLSVLAALAFPAVAPAQTARVVTANSSGRIVDVVFDPPSSTVLNTDASSRVKLSSVAFLDDGADGLHLIVADRHRGQVVFYPDGAGTGLTMLDKVLPGHPSFPDGLALDVEDNLFGTSSASGVGADKDARVWVLRRDEACGSGCLAGGYAPAVGTLDGTVEITVPIGGGPTTMTVELLEETRIVPYDAGLLDPNDVLVLASDPPAVLRYPAASVAAFLDELALGGTPAEIEPEVFLYPSTADVDPARRLPDGSAPRGMDLTPQGNLLVTSSGGTILSYGPDGTRLSGAGGFVDFASNLGQGKFRIVVGPQDGVFHAFVADRNGGEVLRFRIESDGTGTLDGVMDDAEFPVAIATTTASVVPVPPGSGVTVQPTNLMSSTIETVVIPGATGVSVVLFVDPRELEVVTPPGAPLHRSLLLEEIRADLPAGFEIPPHVRAFRQGDPLLGPPTFLLIVADSDADVLGVVAHVIDESLVLGYEPDCDDLDLTAQPRLFWLPSPQEPPILETPSFIDVTNDCGTTRGLTRSWSLFLASARDTRPTSVIVHEKLALLRAVLARAECVDAGLVRKLVRLLGSAQVELARGGTAAAAAKLAEFSDMIVLHPEAFTGCSVNEGGELRARAASAIFLLGKL